MNRSWTQERHDQAKRLAKSQQLPLDVRMSLLGAVAEIERLYDEALAVRTWLAFANEKNRALLNGYTPDKRRDKFHGLVSEEDSCIKNSAAPTKKRNGARAGGSSRATAA